MKQLTQAVFDLPECPPWAKSAAVDSNGMACWYENYKHQLINRGESFDVSYSTDRAQYIGTGYDTTDWQNSAINREV